MLIAPSEIDENKEEPILNFVHTREKSNILIKSNGAFKINDNYI